MKKQKMIKRYIKYLNEIKLCGEIWNDKEWNRKYLKEYLDCRKLYNVELKK